MVPELSSDVLRQAMMAFHSDDAPAVLRLLDRFPELKARINDPIGGFDSPLITQVRSRAMLDVLLDAGADVNGRSKWWAGGFGLLDSAGPELAAYAIERGATMTVHAAARLGWMGKLRELISADSSLVSARGGDGQTALHFASTVEIADYLLDNGADIDARDVDHVSTPAQYMIGKRQDIARHLIRRGCATDILAAAALGDIELAGRLLEANPECIRMRVSEEYFPMVGGPNGGTIYQWELGWHVSAVQVARKFGHAEIFDFLMGRCPAEEKLLNACWLHDGPGVRALLNQNPELAARLNPAGHRQLAHAARNNDTAAAALMVEAGLPVDKYSQHHATALHWAAWHGNLEVVRLILQRKPSLDDASNDFQGTPAGWAVHGSENGWDRLTQSARGNTDYGGVLELLLDAGAPVPAEAGGTPPVRAVLRRHGVS